VQDFIEADFTNDS